MCHNCKVSTAYLALSLISFPLISSLCPVHRYSNSVGTANECVACSVNTYQGVAGRASCETCAIGQFQPSIGQSACLETSPPTPVPTQPPTYDGSLRLDVSMKLNATADLSSNSSRCARVCIALYVVLSSFFFCV